MIVSPVSFFISSITGAAVPVCVMLHTVIGEKSMSKAIVVTVGKATFLAETDESIEILGETESSSDLSVSGISEGMVPMVHLKAVKKQFSGVKELIVEYCNELSDAIPKIAKPEKFAVEFGIKLVGELGIPMITKASGEASIKVSIEWKPNQ